MGSKVPQGLRHSRLNGLFVIQSALTSWWSAPLSNSERYRFRVRLRNPGALRRKAFRRPLMAWVAAPQGLLLDALAEHVKLYPGQRDGVEGTHHDDPSGITWAAAVL
jgi:hypothetical protein